jgi:hypothetical protein
MPVRVVIALIAALALGGCAVECAKVAQDAKAQMVGMTKEQVLACMGPPVARMAEASTEVWSYSSGGKSITLASTSSNTQGSAEATAIGNAAVATGRATTTGFGSAVTMNRYCTVNVVMTGNAVTAINYAGPTGGLLTAGEQCSYAVRNCAR